MCNPDPVAGRVKRQHRIRVRVGVRQVLDVVRRAVRVGVPLADCAAAVPLNGVFDD